MPVCRFLPYSTIGCSSLLTGRSAVGGPPGGSVVVVIDTVSSSATTTRRMSSSSTTPTIRSPSATRHGPRLSSTMRAASRTIWLDWRIGPSALSSSGSRITHLSVSTWERGTSLTKSRT